MQQNTCKHILKVKDDDTCSVTCCSVTLNTTFSSYNNLCTSRNVPGFIVCKWVQICHFLRNNYLTALCLLSTIGSPVRLIQVTVSAWPDWSGLNPQRGDGPRSVRINVLWHVITGGQGGERWSNSNAEQKQAGDFIVLFSWGHKATQHYV